MNIYVRKEVKSEIYVQFNKNKQTMKLNLFILISLFMTFLNNTDEKQESTESASQAIADIVNELSELYLVRFKLVIIG